MCFFDRYIERSRAADIHAVTQRIKEQIGYDELCANAEIANHRDARLQRQYVCELDELVESIADIYFLADDSQPINIGGRIYQVEYVKHRYSKLDFITVDYILGCMNKTKSRIKNIKKYMAAVLFNASTTVESYLRAEINADMASRSGFYGEYMTRLKGARSYA